MEQVAESSAKDWPLGNAPLVRRSRLVFLEFAFSVGLHGRSTACRMMRSPCSKSLGPVYYLRPWWFIELGDLGGHARHGLDAKLSKSPPLSSLRSSGSHCRTEVQDFGCLIFVPKTQRFSIPLASDELKGRQVKASLVSLPLQTNPHFRDFPWSWTRFLLMRNSPTRFPRGPWS